MKSRNRVYILSLAPILIVLMGALPLASAAPDQKGEHYTATAVGVRSPVGGRSVPVNIHVDEMTSDGELRELQNLLQEKGEDALLNRLEEVEKGRMGRADEVGIDIAIVRSYETDEGRKLILVGVRDRSIFELRSSSRTNLYPYTWIELTLDEQGRGSGKVAYPARLKFDDQGNLEVKEFGLEFVRLMNVRRR
ncbi:MAG TPA: hypothetical protein VLU25_00645 [Acidobacteriota bacterium]|nr:hypothetical protein [Acidobacteriota bacterium]